jgi:hypothetical protein
MIRLIVKGLTGSVYGGQTCPIRRRDEGCTTHSFHFGLLRHYVVNRRLQGAAIHLTHILVEHGILHSPRRLSLWELPHWLRTIICIGEAAIPLELWGILRQLLDFAKVIICRL